MTIIKNRNVNFDRIVIMLCALLYGYESILRVSLSTIKPELTSAFSLDASMFGTLSALFFYTYAPLQIFVGIFVDKLKVKLVVIAAIFICVLGTLMMSLTHNFMLVKMGRLLQGVGSAFCYIGALKIAAERCSKKHFPISVGFIAATGFIAAGVGQVGMSYLLLDHSWRQIIQYLSYIGIFLLGLFVIFMRSSLTDSESVIIPQKASVLLREGFSNVGQILKNPQILMIALFATCLYIPTTLFADLWGIPYLKSVHHYTTQQAALGTSMIFYGWAIGSIASGFVANKFNSRVQLMRIAVVAAFFLAIVLLYFNLQNWIMYILFFLFGLVSAMQTLCYVLIKENKILQHMQGTAMATLNLLVSAAGLIFQQGLGYLLDLFWHHGALYQGVRVYTATEYKYAIIILPLALLTGFYLSYKITETACEEEKSGWLYESI